MAVELVVKLLSIVLRVSSFLNHNKYFNRTVNESHLAQVCV